MSKHLDFKGQEISKGDLVGLPLPEGLQPVIVTNLLSEQDDQGNYKIEIKPNPSSDKVFTIPAKNTFLIKKAEVINA